MPKVPPERKGLIELEGGIAFKISGLQTNNSVAFMPIMSLNHQSPMDKSNIISIENALVGLNIDRPITLLEAELMTTPFHLKEGTRFGEHVAGQGNYLGITTLLSPAHAPHEQNVRRYYVFMAPEDLPRSAINESCVRLDEARLFSSYDQLNDEVHNLKDWHGHDGYVATNTSILRQALENGQAVGKWVTPPDPVWFGNREPGSDPTELMPLVCLGNQPCWSTEFDHRDYIHYSNGERRAIVYAICNEPAESDKGVVRVVQLPEEDHGTTPFKNQLKMCARLVRFVPVPDGPRKRGVTTCAGRQPESGPR